MGQTLTRHLRYQAYVLTIGSGVREMVKQMRHKSAPWVINVCLLDVLEHFQLKDMLLRTVSTILIVLAVSVRRGDFQSDMPVVASSLSAATSARPAPDDLHRIFGEPHRAIDAPPQLSKDLVPAREDVAKPDWMITTSAIPLARLL